MTMIIVTNVQDMEMTTAWMKMENQCVTVSTVRIMDGEKTMTNNTVPTDTCVTCENFIGGGDWGLCCKIKYDLCYECTPKCKDYKQKEVRKNGK